jgi:23S rRNA U2552 (ribose-2'-O)-methylase RlmE/FtsJ
MNEWLSKDYVSCYSNKNPKDYRKLLKLEPKFSEKPSRASQSLIDGPFYKTLLESKKSIETCSEWEKWSKTTNPYEKIGKIAKSSSKTGFSRSFFKMYELLKFFENYLPNIPDKEFKSAHLCEAPGSFVKAVLKLKPECDWYAQSLYDGYYAIEIDSDIYDKQRWIQNGSGSLCNLENITDFVNKIEDKVHLITADGSFDVSYDPNSQEQLTSQLIFAEVVTALHCQEVSGTFICKLFDTNTKPMSQLLYLLSEYYENIFLIKPRTSRYSNSEKYVVATNFRGITNEDLAILDSVVQKWHESSEKHIPFCRDFGSDFIEPSDSFKIFLKDYNKKLSKNQFKYIKDSLNGSTWTPGYYRTLEAFQNRRASEFCESFDIGSRIHMQSCKHLKTRHAGSGIRKCDKCMKLLI